MHLSHRNSCFVPANLRTSPIPYVKTIALVVNIVSLRHVPASLVRLSTFP
jgi:hypothetical protein